MIRYVYLKKRHAKTCNSAMLTLYLVCSNYVLQRSRAKTCGLESIVSMLSIVVQEFCESLTACSGLVLC